MRMPIITLTLAIGLHLVCQGPAAAEPQKQVARTPAPARQGFLRRAVGAAARAALSPIETTANLVSGGMHVADTAVRTGKTVVGVAQKSTQRVTVAAKMLQTAPRQVSAGAAGLKKMAEGIKALGQPTQTLAADMAAPVAALIKAAKDPFARFFASTAGPSKDVATGGLDAVINFAAALEATANAATAVVGAETAQPSNNVATE